MLLQTDDYECLACLLSSYVFGSIWGGNNDGNVRLRQVIYIVFCTDAALFTYDALVDIIT